MSNIKKIISRIRTGGQSGVDRAAMDFAREQGVPICGWCPKHGWAEDYPDSPGLLRDYPELSETPSDDTEQRTKWNIRDSGAILTIMPDEAIISPGTEIGLNESRLLSKPMFIVHGTKNASTVALWISDLPEETELCIGGPRASEWIGAYQTTMAFLHSVWDYYALYIE